MAKGCLNIFFVFIVILAVSSMVHDCNEENEPKVHKYWRVNGETGEVDSFSVVKGHEYDHKKKMIEELNNKYKRKKEEVELPKPTHNELPQRQSVDFHSDAYDEGYDDGYRDGEDDGVQGFEYGMSFSSSGSRRDDYGEGYTDGYENGYYDNHVEREY